MREENEREQEEKRAREKGTKIYKVYFQHLEGQRSKEIVTEGRERPCNFVPKKSDFAIDFDVLYTVKYIPAEKGWRQELVNSLKIF